MHSEKLREAAERYNSRAEELGWKSRFDPELAFDRESLRNLLHAWDERAQDGLPMRSAFDARSLKPILPYLCIAEKVEAGGRHSWRWRLFGTKLVSMLGEYTGKMLEDALPPEHVERWAFGYDICVDFGVPMRIVSDFQLNRMDHLSGETLVLPLADEKGDATLLFAVAMVRMKETEPGPYS